MSFWTPRRTLVAFLLIAVLVVLDVRYAEPNPWGEA